MVNQLEMGQADADLGGGVYKLRVARTGDGKRGGYRVIVFFKSGDRTFYRYGFAKSVQGNIGKGELKTLKKQAKKYLTLSDEQLIAMLANGILLEII